MGSAGDDEVPPLAACPMGCFENDAQMANRP